MSEETSRLLTKETTNRLLNRASAEAGAIQAQLRIAIDAARIAADTFEALASDGPGGVPAPDRRAQFNPILSNILLENPAINGTYSAWEPDALDGNDQAFEGRRDTGADATGRFLPYWTRYPGGRAVVEPLAGHEDASPGSNGGQAGAWYLVPRDTKKEIVIAPLTYEAAGRIETLATFAIPVVIDGRFRGITGANFNLAFIQKLAEDVSASIFGGAATVMIVSENGYVIADSTDPSLAGKSIEAAGDA